MKGRGRESGHASMRDVAEAAGVSRAAVSLVLNGRKIRISEEKRAAILREARRLRYRPNVSALRLKRRKTDTLRFVLPGDAEALSELYVLELIRNLAAEARRSRYDLLLELAESPGEDLVAIDPGRADGSIFLLDHSGPSALVHRIEEAGHPFAVLGGSRMKNQPAYLVDFDVEEGTCEITRYLIGLGHRHIAFLAGVPSPHKETGYRRALKEAGLPVRKQLSVLSGLKESSIAKALEGILRADPRPTALVATNDTLAIRAIKTLLGMGLSVPGDLSVTGFDDIETASLISPRLTTVHIPLDELARNAVQLLLAQIEGRKLGEASRIMVATRLVVGKSTRPNVG